MSAITITSLNTDTVFLCAKYLVGGFDKNKNYYSPSIWLTSHMSWVYENLCRRAWNGSYEADQKLELFILRELIHGTYFNGVWNYEGQDYHFKLRDADSLVCLNFLKSEVIAQCVDE